MTNEPTEAEADTEQARPTWRRVFGTAFFIAVIAAACWLGFGTAEFGLNVDGYGLGHLEYPSLITAVLVHFCIAATGILATLVYKGKIPALVSLPIGFLFLFLGVLVIFATIPWHYERLCDVGEMPRACEIVVETTVRESSSPYGHKFERRAEFACQAGRADVCDIAVEHDLIEKDDACEVLADRCAQVERCLETSDPQACAEDEGLAHYYSWTDAYCDAHKARCPSTDSPN